ncbi:membrane protein [Rhodomicrobium udaipurense JA643]|uniref:Porin family protein n=1 Tax=Rhodomicrobium udaipurense TaxID=1202716 RepID=A0A8I1KLG6_9HYPH|nr:outer membrane beta-barrel protein [Rhodomicrobium udaipurense]KAI93337.1 membrane protein [Rhodomicrobium udaipurense JA643]MBJ7543313.1 porin family protein [Rhodomicrobium udaipurense]
MTLTKFALASTVALGTLAIAAQANAADIYTPTSMKDAPIIVVPPTWTGFYFGGHLGAAWTQLETRKNEYWDGYDDSDLSFATFGGKNLNDQSAFGGGQFGYNWQTGGNFVLGIEVDIGGLGSDNERTFLATTYNDVTFSSAYSTAVVNVKSEGGFYGDVTGRLGYAWGNTLLYAKGGFAWIQPELKVRTVVSIDDDPNGTYTSSHTYDDTLTGWTIGGGLEFLLNPNWSVKVEYLHYDFELDNNNNRRWNDWDVDYNNWRLFKDSFTVDTVKLGVNYKLSQAPVYAPLK